MGYNFNFDKDEWGEDEELLALRVAYEFAKETFDLADKNKYFPFKYKMIVDTIKAHAMIIPTLINIGKWEKKSRKECGEKAIKRIDDSLFLMKLLYKLDSNLGSKPVNKWKSKACEVKRITKAWIKNL